MFQDALRESIGSFVQIITPIDIISGTLIAVFEASIVVRTSSSYGEPTDVTIPLHLSHTFVLLVEMNKMNVSVIIPACNEEESLQSVIQAIKKIAPFEIIVVVNGATDNTALIAKQEGCKVLTYEEKLGINIGRAIGAKKQRGISLYF